MILWLIPNSFWISAWLTSGRPASISASLASKLSRTCASFSLRFICSIGAFLQRSRGSVNFLTPSAMWGERPQATALPGVVAALDAVVTPRLIWAIWLLFSARRRMRPRLTCHFRVRRFARGHCGSEADIQLICPAPRPQTARPDSHCGQTPAADGWARSRQPGQSRRRCTADLQRFAFRVFRCPF